MAVVQDDELLQQLLSRWVEEVETAFAELLLSAGNKRASLPPMPQQQVRMLLLNNGEIKI